MTSPTTLWFDQALVDKGWAQQVRISVNARHISAIETGCVPTEHDECHAIGIPGLPNLHSHAFQRGMAGLAETRGPASDNFWTWRQIMYRFVDTIGPLEAEAIATLAYMEMLEGGFTRVGEFHYLHHDPAGAAYANPAEMAEAIAAAAQAAGIALTLLPVFYAHAGFGGTVPLHGQRRFVTSTEQFARLFEQCRVIVAALPGARLGIAPHSLRAVTPEELKILLALGGDGPVHIHAAEQLAEVTDCLDWSGARPVEWLLDNAPVDERWCLIHATHIEPFEVKRLAASGAVAGLCPITEGNLGDGIFPAVDFMAAGGRFGIGTDSNILLDATEELRMLEYSQRLLHRKRNMLADSEGASVGGQLYRRALGGGGQALGASSDLAIGAPADIVSLDAAHPSLQLRQRDLLLDGLIFAAGRNAIDCVWRGGQKMVSGGRHHARSEITERYRAALTRILV